MHISDAGVRFIAGFEGFSSTPYWDSYGRVWTRGFGETEGISQHSPPISRQAGERRLRSLIEQRYEWAVNGLGVPLTQNAYDALCSFAWNLGAGIFKGNLRSALTKREWKRAGSLMLQYDHAGGVRLAGLTRRRRAEVDLMLKAGPAPAPANELDVLTDEERRVVNSLIKYAKQPKLHPHGLKVSHDKIVELRKAVWVAAEKGRLPDGRPTQKGWDIRDRRRRYNLLWKYSR